MILPGVTGGWLLAFINSFDEVTMSIFVTSPSTVTLPVRMYMYATESIDPLMAAVSALMVAVTAVRDDACSTVLLRARPRAGGRAQMSHEHRNDIERPASPCRRDPRRAPCRSRSTARPGQRWRATRC